MAEARVSAALSALLLVAPASAVPASAQSRFVSYLTEGECVAGHVLAPAVCRSAFANARAEFEAKTPAYSSLAECAKAFGACAAWSSGAKGRGEFRPRWSGVDIVDTPREKSVTPGRVKGNVRVSFAPRPLTGPAQEPRELVVRPSRPALVGRAVPPQGGNKPVQHAFRAPAAGPALGPSPPPPPGSGFKLENGVLTYPAPARFAPKNLPKLD